MFVSACKNVFSTSETGRLHTEVEAMIISSIEGGFLGGTMYNEINRQKIRVTHLGTVAPFHTECNFNANTWYHPVCLLFLNYQAFKYSLYKWVTSFHGNFHLRWTVNLRDLPVQAIRIPVNIMKVTSAATYKSYSNWQMTAGGVISLILVNCKVGMRLSQLVFQKSGGRRDVKKM